MDNQTSSNQEGVTFKLLPEFEPFRKIPRLNRDIVITEKLDGTNASIMVTDEGDIYAGKRTSWCTPEKDNYGFAKWVYANKDELIKLGPGRHFGEWWGNGIQRNYGLAEKRFSLFNVERYGVNRPTCCGVVPVLYRGIFSGDAIKSSVEQLRVSGSLAVPGWMKPEGIVVFHSASNSLFKVTCENDEKPKTQVEG